MAFSTHSNSHSRTVIFDGSTSSLLLWAFTNSARFFSACRWLPRNVIHFCLRFIAPVFGSGWSPTQGSGSTSPRSVS